MYYYAAVHGAEVAAEDVVTLMLNRGLAPTQRIADAFIAGLLGPATNTAQITMTEKGDNNNGHGAAQTEYDSDLSEDEGEEGEGWRGRGLHS